MQKNIFKKITSSVCSLVMSYGVCFAGGPNDPSTNNNSNKQEDSLNIIVDYFTNNESYKNRAPFESIECGVKNRLEVYAESLVENSDAANTLTPSQKQKITHELSQELANKFAREINQEFKLMLETPASCANINVQNTGIWKNLADTAANLLNERLRMPVFDISTTTPGQQNQNTAEVDACQKGCDPLGVMIRSYNTPVSKLRTMWDKSETSICCHFCVEDKKVHFLLPPKIVSAHCGGVLNRHHLTIMMIEPPDLKYNLDKSAITTTKEELTEEHIRYYKETYNTAVKLTSCLVKIFNMDLSKKLTIIGHYEARELTPKEVLETIPQFCLASNKSTPGHVFPLFGLSMEQFREDVKTLLNYWKKFGYSETEKQLIKNMEENLKKYTLQ